MRHATAHCFSKMRNCLCPPLLFKMRNRVTQKHELRITNYELLIGRVVSPAFGDVGLASSKAHQFVEQRGLPRGWTQDSPQALDMFAHRTGAGYDDSHAGCRHIYAFVEHLAGDQHGITPLPEGIQEGDSLGRLGVVGDDGKAEGGSDTVGGRVVGGENDRAVVPVDLEQLVDLSELCAGGTGDAA